MALRRGIFGKEDAAPRTALRLECVVLRRDVAGHRLASDPNIGLVLPSELGHQNRHTLVQRRTMPYQTSSDYRLKYDGEPLSGFGDRLDALRPRSFKWRADDSADAGFYAHEFAEVYPQVVHGDKDAVDESGVPKYQSMQASHAAVIADVVAEIQDLRRRVDQLENG